MSNFQDDLKAEELMGECLDKYFYTKLDCTRVGTLRVNKLNPIDRVKTAQKVGVDIILKDSKSEMYFVDEKAQLLYLNNPLPTFAFEIQYEKNGVVEQGWLFDDTKKTTNYLLIYPKSELRMNIKEVNHFEDFSSVELLLINRNKLEEELKVKGINKQMLGEQVNKIKVYDKKIYIGDNEWYLMKSSEFTEKPVNLVIRRTLLDRVSIAKWDVSKIEIIENKKMGESWTENI